MRLGSFWRTRPSLLAKTKPAPEAPALSYAPPRIRDDSPGVEFNARGPNAYYFRGPQGDSYRISAPAPSNHPLNITMAGEEGTMLINAEQLRRTALWPRPGLHGLQILKRFHRCTERRSCIALYPVRLLITREGPVSPLDRLSLSANDRVVFYVGGRPSAGYTS